MRKSTLIWLLLIALTSLTLSFASINTSNFTFIAIILLTTFFKGEFIIDYFMGLKEVKVKYRMILLLWLFLLIFLIGLAFYLPIN